MMAKTTNQCQRVLRQITLHPNTQPRPRRIIRKAHDRSEIYELGEQWRILSLFLEGAKYL